MSIKCRLLAIFLVVLVLWISVRGQFNETQTPPFDLPILMQQAGMKVQTDFHIVEDREYIFSLVFRFNKDDPADRARVKKLVGEDGQDKNGDPGVPTPLKIGVSSILADGERPIFDTTTVRLNLE